MELIQSEDQELLAKTAADFVADHSPVSRLRALRDARDETGFSRELWKEMAELGWVGIPFSERHGGADMGLAELAVVLEELGRKLAPEPFLSNVLLAGRVLARAGSEAQRERWLPSLVSGDALLALAIQEKGTRYDADAIALRAEPDGDGFRLQGCKEQVLDGQVADAIVVAARSAGAPGEREGVSLVLVEADAPGLRRERQWRVDDRGAARVEFEGVHVPASSLVGAPGAALPVLEEAIDAATVGLCAEMLGGMQEVFDLTLEHLKQREQFGVAIGTFQALKHRAARVFIAIELARSCTMAAARAVDAEEQDAATAVSLAKARCNDAYILATNEAVQMFGGVGMTDEYDIGFYMKRARASALSFGDSAWHRDRWARSKGF